MKKILYNIIYATSLSLLIVACSKTDSSNSITTSKVGSTARFAIMNDRLYTVDESDLKIVDISNLSDLKSKGTFKVGERIETIFPFKNKLFIGSSSGMYAYDVSNPDVPTNKKFVEHITGCDPVVADDSSIFVTVTSERVCGGSLVERSAILSYKYNGDINNIQETGLLNGNKPLGLAIHSKILYVCDQEQGIDVYKIKQSKLELFKSLNFNETGNAYYDVIPYNNFMVLQTKKGIKYIDITVDSLITPISAVEK